MPHPLFTTPSGEFCNVASGGKGHDECDLANRPDFERQARLLHLDPTASQDCVEGYVSASVIAHGQALTFAHSNQLGGNVVIKSVNHSRLQRERDILVRFQQRSSRIRPLLDEVEPDMPTHALVMKWLSEDLSTRKLAGAQLKLVAKSVLEALQALHADGYVHTG